MGKWRLYSESFVSVCRTWYEGRKGRGRIGENRGIKKYGQAETGRNTSVIDYESYTFTKEELVQYLSIGILLVFFISYLFYENILISFLFLPLSILYLKKQKRKLIEERKWKLNLQFREGLTAVLGALNAGYSIENSFAAALKDLRLLYEKEEPIIEEFEGIVAGLKVNRNIELLLSDLGARSGVEDIETFAEIFSVCKRTGGDLIRIISSTLEHIEDKMEVKQQIKTLTAAKKLESKIMSVVPLGIIIYMKLFSGGLLEPLYHNFSGILIMTVLLIAYLAAFELAEKITDIEM